ncbi:hypothetical protein Pse7367_0231 [Thalassoporum mexicanum PCC 7367]|uniref:heterocyst frequency control protein PatD n=1 Tax=Thalassoporum mexicanum TaxID=3457544 RepID=UPI00029FC26E|nr:heterocyst frequency control protein PatD [Pseudanabaena sp. PCC 7367]AFY68547.1 hypothetical protein Pse7367_0231 [Pseudanabaena sp. PCC 7367]
MTHQPDKYQAFKAKLAALKDEIAIVDTAYPESARSARSHLKTHAALQNFFRTEILNQQDQPDQGDRPHEQQLNEQILVAQYVEVNKQLRLLGADLNMLQAARNPATFQQRKMQISDRLNTLIGMCNALMQI